MTDDIERINANAQHEAQKVAVQRDMQGIKLQLKELATDDSRREALEAEHEGLRRKFCAMHGISAEPMLRGAP